ncbi:ribbon-helix-helix protein, CopG family [Microbacterium sp.]|uniref:ribbon-helix-helix protein, CopG family n=1 Tax=Microbacterium sp. TaxID=51671 RepID=UPI0025E0886F|nr:ribbon-helix-helix protein, CopG family [Microbacterium sp.]
MKRTQISLEEDDRELLDDAAARTGKSMSALVRDAVRMAYAHDDTDADLNRIDRAFGAWSDDDRPHRDGEASVESLRTGGRWAHLDS